MRVQFALDCLSGLRRFGCPVSVEYAIEDVIGGYDAFCKPQAHCRRLAVFADLDKVDHAPINVEGLADRRRIVGAVSVPSAPVATCRADRPPERTQAKSDPHGQPGNVAIIGVFQVSPSAVQLEGNSLS